MLEKSLSSDLWVDSLTNCGSDISLKCNDGRNLVYHSECGTFNDKDNNKSLALSEETKDNFNEMLKEYIPSFY